YKKREGLVDRGRDYEWLLSALYALRFSINNEIVDFNMTTSNEEGGQFDDIVLKVTFENDKQVNFFFQLKHKERHFVSQEMLVRKEFKHNGRHYKSKYYIPELMKSTPRYKSNEEVYFILYTNSEVKITDTNLRFGQESYSLNVEECNEL